ncbi:integrase catalytic domain-containing protein [Trichonephila clavipes]|uniref:Integrase catalytic domain-containing protein n=1 Tax=Trichonephila clavipes TaxID=2585209 RepID=A0A8X6RAW8_TRICX|nr:integrase catalytic domain-containing protein [Trichonephila clavipes]
MPRLKHPPVGWGGSNAEAQKDDTELLDLQTRDNSLKLEKIEVPGSDVTLICDTSMPRTRPFVLASERRRVFNALHGLRLPGSRATVRLISLRFVWPRVQSDCRNWSRACLHCQRSKITRHNSSPLQTFASTPL